MTDLCWEFFDKGEHPDPKAHWRHYRCNGELTTPNGLRIVSVTQALGVLDSPALVGWAANVTAQGAWTLLQDPSYKVPDDMTLNGGEVWVGWRRFLKDIREAKLDHDSTRDEAALRGTTVHDMHEDWVKHGKVPNPQAWPEHWRGYMRAMVRYMMDTEKAGETPESVELVLGSATYGFAGKCDTVSVLTGRDGKRKRRDFKTSKQVYARKHFRQLEAYELADVEMGTNPTDERSVVILRPDGTWYEDPSTATAVGFLNVLQVWRDDQPLQKLEDKAYRARVKYDKAAKEKEAG